MFAPTKLKNRIISSLMLTLSIIANTHAAEAVDAAPLLNELSENIERLREIDTRGQNILDERDKIRQDIARLESDTADLSQSKSAIDKESAAYKVEAEAYNAECIGSLVTGPEANKCRDWIAQLDRMEAALESKAGRLNPRVNAYNTEIDSFNKQDGDLKRQSEELFAQAQGYEKNINQLRADFVTLAARTRNNSFIESVDTCSELTGFEDILKCQTVVWGRL